MICPNPAISLRDTQKKWADKTGIYQEWRRYTLNLVTPWQTTSRRLTCSGRRVQHPHGGIRPEQRKAEGSLRT